MATPSLPKNKLVCIFILLLLLIITGCSSSRENPISGNNPGAQAPGSALDNLPAPAAALARMAHAAGDPVYGLFGRQFEAGLCQHLAIEGDCARFSPDWTPDDDAPEGLAYGIYRFNLTGYSGTMIFFSLAWIDAPQLPDNTWLGFSDWQRGTWKWYACPTGGTLLLSTPGGLEPYIKPGTGEMLVALVMTGQEGGLLHQCGVQFDPVSDSWPVFGHDAQHTGRSMNPGPDTATLKWKFKTNGPGDALSSPAIDAGGTAYLRAKDTVYAIDPNGGLLWTCTPAVTEDGSSGIAVKPDGTSYIGTGYEAGGTNYAGVAEIGPGGTCNWIYYPDETANGINTPAVDASGKIYFVVNGYLYILNQDGTLASKTGSGTGYSSPVVLGPDGSVYIQPSLSYQKFTPEGVFCWEVTAGILHSTAEVLPLAAGADGKIYVNSTGYLTAFDANGSQVWQSSIVLDSAQPAIGDDGTIYTGGRDGMGGDQAFFAVNPDGSTKWQIASDGVVNSPHIGADGLIYYADTALHAVNTDGMGQWSLPLRDHGAGKIAIDASGRLYVLAEFLTRYYEDGLCMLCVVDPNGNLAWNFGTGGWLQAAPVIGEDQTIYFGSGDCRVYAVNPDGTEKWHYDNDMRFTCSPVVTPDNNVYAVDYLGSLHALDSNGLLLWRFDPSYSSAGFCPPVVAPDGKIYYGEYGDVSLPRYERQGQIYVLNTDGTLARSHVLESEIYMSPILRADGSYIISSYNGDVSCIDAAGTLLWQSPLNGILSIASPLAPDNTCYFGAYDGLQAIDSNGTLKWSFGSLINNNSAPVLAADGTVYFSEGKDTTSGLNIVRACSSAGSALWTSDVEISYITALALDGTGCIYAGSTYGKLYVFNPDGSQKMVFDTQTGSWITSAVIGAERTVYFGSAYGNLYAVSD